MNDKDIISELPKDVIDSILERLPIKDAVRTSVLSKKWRDSWVSIRKLTCDESFFRAIVKVDEAAEIAAAYSKHAEIVQDLLLQHSGPLDTFYLHVEPYCGEWGSSIAKDLYNRILHLVSSKGVKDCTIVNGDCCGFARDYGENDDLKVFPSLFSCSEITRLKVYNILVSIPPTFKGFANLVRLEFWGAVFCGESFRLLMSTCPRLEHLELDCCYGSPVGSDVSDSTMNICSSSIRHLVVGLFNGNSITIDTNKLETLSVKLEVCYLLSSIRPCTALDCLRSLEVYYSDSRYQDMLVCLFQKAPNILEIKLDLTHYCCRDPMETVVEFWEASSNQVILKQLKLLKITLLRCSEEELFLVKVLLARTPALEKFDVVRGKTSLSRLAQFPRASPMAKLVFNGVATDW